MDILYTPSFMRQLESLPFELQEEALDAIDDVRTATNHRRLKVHKLKGKLSGRYAFSVNYKIRIVFSYTKEKHILLLAIGDHDIYN